MAETLSWNQIQTPAAMPLVREIQQLTTGFQLLWMRLMLLQTSPTGVINEFNEPAVFFNCLSFISCNVFLDYDVENNLRTSIHGYNILTRCC
ncbi:WD repeat-containing 70 [Gossypium arboreum]|uniref:WD repeat-containing 70 n=1 Tax=Gossypium arboreum TaxID=29729 RepID=A0A0B0MEU0_GOSAR|nr:WD repeat-containing 70 [Gossypium arboreum]